MMMENKLKQLFFIYILIAWIWLFTHYKNFGQAKYDQLVNENNSECHVGEIIVL
jgi:hypothetical protein